MEDRHRTEAMDAALQSQRESLQRIEQLMNSANPRSVFGEPMQVGESQVLTASETVTGLGFGFGVGGANETEADEAGPQAGAGGGGGGGGMATGRPVAVIRATADGVSVEPIVDVTKIALAVFTTLGTMFLMFGRMARRAR